MVPLPARRPVAWFRPAGLPVGNARAGDYAGRRRFGPDSPCAGVISFCRVGPQGRRGARNHAARPRNHGAGAREVQEARGRGGAKPRGSRRIMVWKKIQQMTIVAITITDAHGTPRRRRRPPMATPFGPRYGLFGGRVPGGTICAACATVMPMAAPTLG